MSRLFLDKEDLQKMEGDMAMLRKKIEKEIDENRELVCTIFEMMSLFLPIIPSSLWNRLLLVCFYVVLYNVKGHERYFEMKQKYLSCPKKNIELKYQSESDDEDSLEEDGEDESNGEDGEDDSNGEEDSDYEESKKDK